MRSSTGCLCTVAQDQILFVQWCVWANLSMIVDLVIRPEERSKSACEVKARDYVKMASWDNRSGYRTPSQASSVPCFRLLREREQPSHPVYSAHKNLTPDLVNGLIHGPVWECPAVKPEALSQQNEKARRKNKWHSR